MNRGSTSSERFLAGLCRSSFLSLWTYPNAYRDQKATGVNGDGKEICDALIVFGDKVILFSDKEIEYRSHPDANVSWSRWYKNAIAESKNQLDGGVRWINQHPDRVFADKKCTQRIALTDGTSDRLKFYRIVVANGVSSQISKELGGSGSLIIAHSGRNPLHESRFGIYEIRSSYQDDAIYHVFDEYNLRDILEALDTISDFVAYLDSREWLFRSGVSIYAPGEEELLAQYLQYFDLQRGRGFQHFNDYDLLSIEEGTWKEFKEGPYFGSARQANRISRVWDEIVEAFSSDLMGGRIRGSQDFEEIQVRRPLELMASENRFNRRILGQSLHEVKFNDIESVDQYVRVTRTAAHMPTTYVLYALKQPSFASRDDYVEVRRNLLYDYCLVAKWKNQIAGNIVGIGLDRGYSEVESFDLVHFEPRSLTESEVQEAKVIHEERGFLTRLNGEHYHSFEYPYEGSPSRQRIRIRNLKGNMRNQRCPCGSGRKYKQCCGRKRKVSADWDFLDL